MIAVIKDKWLVEGMYDSYEEAVSSNFSLELLPPGQIRITSRHFTSYINTEIISGLTYASIEERNDGFTREDAINDFIKHHLPKYVKPYGIKFYKTEEL